MASIGGVYNRTERRHWRTLRTLVWLGIILVIATGMSGCSGCRKSPPKTLEELEKELAQKKEKPKDPFEAKRLVTQPAGGTSAGVKSTSAELTAEELNDRESAGRLCKVGHWTGVSWENVIANDYDFMGEMEIAANDVKGQRLPLPATPYNLTTARQAALPKGQPKIFDSVLYVPPNTPKAFISCRLERFQGRRHRPGTGIARAKHAFVPISLHRFGPGARSNMVFLIIFTR